MTALVLMLALALQPCSVLAAEEPALPAGTAGTDAVEVMGEEGEKTSPGIIEGTEGEAAPGTTEGVTEETAPGTSGEQGESGSEEPDGSAGAQEVPVIQQPEEDSELSAYAGNILELSGIFVQNRVSQVDMGVVYNTNDPDVKFQWKVYNLQTRKWEMVSSWKEGNWTTWEPEEAGWYWLHAEAKDSAGNIKTYTISYYYEGVRLKLNGIYVVNNGKSIDLGAVCETNDPGVKFQWKLYDLQEKTWKMISGWQEGNWTTWKPEKEGGYWFHAEAKDSRGTVKTYTYAYYVHGAEITSFHVSPDTLALVGNQVLISGKNSDPLGQIARARYLIYDGKSWKELSPQADGTVIWNADTEGNYLLCYGIYEEDGTVIEQKITPYRVEKPYVNLSGIQVQQTGALQYRLTAACQSNDRGIQYCWKYYDVSSGVWHLLKDWSSDSSVAWSAPREGGYWFHVEVRLQNGTEKSYTMAYNVRRYSADVLEMLSRANNYSSSTQYIILVNRRTHKVGIFQGRQGSWSLVKYWDCADGAPGTPTVSGVFTIAAKGYYFDSGASRCYWWTQFYGNYLFHSVLYNKNGTLRDGRVGMALSHGCVRLQINNAKWIYDNIPSRTKVVIY